jgi:hypothetical protein
MNLFFFLLIRVSSVFHPWLLLAGPVPLPASEW